MPNGCDHFKLPIQACLCKADNCYNVSLKYTRTKDVLLIFLDLLLEIYRNGFDELINHMKIGESLQEKDKIEHIKKKYNSTFDKHFADYELFKKMKAVKEVKVENEYRRHVTVTFAKGLSLDIDKCGHYLEEARAFAQLVLKTVGHTGEES